MIRKIKNLVWRILNYTVLGPLLEIYLTGFIKENGWFKSFQTKKSVDKNGDPIPWFTYSFTDFLSERLNKSLVVFEYGCGGSTNWFARRVKSIHSVEDNLQWKEYVEKEKETNVSIIFREIEAYESAVNEYGEIDIVIIDGKKRNECIKASISKLSDRGVLILDDSQREIYNSGKQLLLDAGYRHIDFWGMHPVSAEKGSTTIYYKHQNCLNI